MKRTLFCISRALLVLLLGLTAGPETAVGDTPDGNLLDPAWVRVPEGYSSSQEVRLRRAVELEAAGEGREAEGIYGDLIRHSPRVALAYWHASRALFMVAEGMPPSENPARIELLERALAWAERGLETDPRCAPCMLYKAAALGRMGTIHGPIWGARYVKEIMRLLDQGIELRPDDHQGPQSSTLGNLYFARAMVLRTVPEWFWLRWVLGVRGDVDRALLDITRARELHPERLDLQVEHGVILMCHWVRRGDEESAWRGRRLLRESLGRPALTEGDRKDRRMVEALFEKPERACDLSREGFLDIEEENARASS